MNTHDEKHKHGGCEEAVNHWGIYSCVKRNPAGSNLRDGGVDGFTWPCGGVGGGSQGAASGRQQRQGKQKLWGNVWGATGEPTT